MTSAFAAAELFLAPVLQRDSIVKVRGKSIIERIFSHSAVNLGSGRSQRSAVVYKAVTFLVDIHSFLVISQNDQLAHELLYTSSKRSVIDGLLDLISLEGIYPNLLPGVGVPIERRVKSVLQGRTAVSVTEINDGHERDPQLLLDVVMQLDSIAMSGGKGLYYALQDRIIVDLIAAWSQLAFSPGQDAFTSSSTKALQALLDVTPISILFPTLTSLLHPASPSWLRQHVSVSLSLLPLRTNGVRSTIEFIAHAISHKPTKNEQPSGVVLSIEILNQISNVLSSVPSTMTPEGYFTALAPQLLALLDGEDVDLRRAASYILGNGILGKKTYGAPGSAGWRAFVQPILDNLLPAPIMSPTSELLESHTRFQVLVSNEKVQQAVSRLGALTLIHPNPGLTKRLMAPMLLPIWSLVCNCKSSKTEKTMYIKAVNILYTYLKVSGGLASLTLLSDNLLWNGPQHCRFVLSKTEHIEICTCTTELPQQTDTIALTGIISLRVEIFIDVLTDTSSNSELDHVFLHVLEKWMFGIKHGQNQLRLETDSDDDSFRRLTYAKITEEMLRRKKDDIAARPENLLKLVQQVLEEFVAETVGPGKMQNRYLQPSITTLGSILRSNVEESFHAEELEDSQELVSISLSLLIVLLSSSDIHLTETTNNILNALQESVSSLLYHKTLSQSLISSASTASSLISVLVSSPIPAGSTIRTTSAPATAITTHAMVLQNLISPLPPIRAEGLSSLTSLINSSSPVLDIPSTTVLLLSLLQDDEEFVYLAAIKAFEVLAQKHSKIVLRMLMDRYLDQEEEGGLDVRLRIGEALRVVITALKSSLTIQSAALVGEGLVAIAGRRGHRLKAAEARRKGRLTRENQKKEAEEAWDGPVPHIGDGEDEDEVTTHLADVLAGWDDQGIEEDVRIRTSALSVLGISIKSNLVVFSSALVSTSIDLSIAILKLETKPEKAILRRAAALFLISLVEALDEADEQGPQLAFSFAEEGLLEVSEVLGYLRQMEADEIVNGFEGEVIGELESWRAKKLLGSNFGAGGEIKLSLSEGIRGLDVTLGSGERARPRIEEVE